jgi:alkanesulfonate monooxygenase SsuD/methylene tetrahydromethanopterin reductase-like flavin-dependent oxidoreductase (luciferase family)
VDRWIEASYHAAIRIGNGLLMTIELGMFLQPATRPGRPLADVIDWNVDVIRHADACGFSEVWVGQHITSPWEPLPAPQQIIARAIGETGTIRLGTGVEVLYQSHPVRLATELAQLDHMARGRLMFGFGGGGTPSDAQLYDVDFSTGQHQAMSREALKIILDCWKPGGPDDFTGTYWSVRKPRTSENYYWHLEPFSAPEPRIGFAGFMPNSGSLTIAGERGYIPLSFNVAPEHVAVHWPVVEQAARMAGRTADRTKWRHIREIYVAETAQEARTAMLDGFAAEFWNRYFKVIVERLNIDNLFRRDGAPQDTPVDARHLIDHGIWFVGDPDQVAGQIVEQYRLTGGFGVLLQIGFDYADSGARAGWMRSMELLSRDVMPKVNQALEKG